MTQKEAMKALTGIETDLFTFGQEVKNIPAYRVQELTDMAAIVRDVRKSIMSNFPPTQEVPKAPEKVTA